MTSTPPPPTPATPWHASSALRAAVTAVVLTAAVAIPVSAAITKAAVAPNPNAPAVLVSFPSPGTTGVPAGTPLTNYSGPMTITQCNTIIDSKIVNGDLTIKASNGSKSSATPCVTIKNSLIKGSVNTGYTSAPYCSPAPCGSLLMTDFEVAVPQPNAGNFSAILQTNLHMWRGYVHGARTGIQCDGYCEVHDSYVVADYFKTPQHMDAYIANSASYGTQVLDHNTFLCYVGPGSDSSTNGGCSADVGFFGDFGKITNVTVTSNHFLASGDQFYPVYTGGNQPSKSFPNADHLNWTGNVFDRCPVSPARGSCATPGIPDWGSGNGTNVWCNNVTDTGTAVGPTSTCGVPVTTTTTTVASSTTTTIPLPPPPSTTTSTPPSSTSIPPTSTTTTTVEQTAPLPPCRYHPKTNTVTCP